MRVDWDMHLLEPRKLWRREWVEDIEVPLSSYLQFMDAYHIDIAIVHPTRLFFADIGYNEYDEWAQEFCSKSDGRLIPSLLLSPATKVYFMNPLLNIGPLEGPEHGVVCVHSTRGLLGCTPLDAVSSHIIPILTSYMSVATSSRCDGVAYAFLECDSWWVDPLQRSMRKTSRDLGGLVHLNTKNLYVDGRSLFGSDFPHHDHKPPTVEDGIRLVGGGELYATYVGTV